MSQLRTTAVLLRFQLQAGSRVALRTLAPVAAGVTAASVLYGSPLVVIELARGMYFPPVVSIAAAVFATGVSLTIALASAQRLTSGLSGWARHLPASGAASRRATTAGLAVVQLPVLVIAAAGGLAALLAQPSVTVIRLAALPLLAWSSSLAALRVERGWTRAVAAAAAISAWYGTWTGLIAGLVLVITADLAAGPIATATVRDRKRRSLRGPKILSEPGPPTVAGARIWWHIARRALGWRSVAATIPGLLALVPVLFFLRNNELTDMQHATALRLAAVLGVVLVMAVTADALVKLRPPWPWIRSLPWSALTRVSLDAILLGLIATPVFLLAALLDPGTVLVVAGVMPLLGLRGAAAIRQAPGRLSSASGQMMLEGALVAVLIALIPWVPLVVLALTPFAAWQAAELERNSDISRWHELHHLAAGDPLSWSGA